MISEGYVKLDEVGDFVSSISALCIHILFNCFNKIRKFKVGEFIWNQVGAFPAASWN
jgi:hypothetical protein